jgi:predicted nucleic acid-binding protein
MHLLDTDVLSELRKPRSDANVVMWLETVDPTRVFLSTVTAFEIEFGIERQRRENSAFANELTAWIESVLRLYGDRVLPLTTNIMRRWGRLSLQIGNKNLDGAIAATALEHGLTVVTRNVAHYERTGVPTVNPFEARARRR